MSINEIQDEIIEEFEAFDDWLERYQLIIDYAKELTKDPMPEEDKNDTNKIDGCQSTVWFTCRMEDGKIWYKGDSDTLRFRDSSGKTLLDALREFGGKPEYLFRDCLAPASYHSYFELHIEQGPVLDWNGEDVGIVEAIAAPTRFMLEITGQQAHSGACPMNMRHDALAAAADIILAVERAGREESEFGSVATVGVCQCEPGAMNVVPGRAVLKVDIRGIVEKSIRRVYTQVLNRVRAVEKERGVKIGFTLYSEDKPVVMDGLLARRVENVCRSRGVKYRRMPSGAGHDAMYMASLIPSALIFVPCKDGISHNPDERIEWNRVRPGYEVLLETVRGIVR